MLLGLAVKQPRLALSGPIPDRAAQKGLVNATLTFWGVHSGREGDLGSEWVIAN